MTSKVKKKEKIGRRSDVRILPSTPINKILDTLVQIRAHLEHLIVVSVFKDGAIDFFTTSGRVFETVGLLEALKLEVLENIHCAQCGGVVDGDDEIHE